MPYLMLPLTVLAFAFVLHGFPNIHIGSKKYYTKDKKKDDN